MKEVKQAVDFDYTEEQNMIRTMVRDFAEKEIAIRIYLAILDC